jgi:sporulation protein YlmC with PRC-barrel domain
MRKMVHYLGVGLLTLSLIIAGASFAQAEMKGTSGDFHPTTTNWDTFKASDLIGMQLYTGGMDVLGQISDVVIDPGTKRIARIILSDVPGLGGESVALPFDSVVRIGNNLFAYSAPGKEPYRYGDKPLWSVGLYWLADLDYVLSYVQPIPAEAKESIQLMGTRVETSQGEDVAWINDLVVDSENGHIVYVVLSDVAGMADKQVAVPFDGMLELRENVFALNTTKDRLLAAPAFNWEDATDRKYAEDIYRYYGLQPYWETE